VFNVFAVENTLLMLLTVVLLAVKAWAFLDALSHRAEAYPAADKMTKKAWLIILGIFLAAHLVFWSPLGILNIIGTIAALVYLVDARPALRSLSRR
jgi:hypothetical protein